MSREGEDVKSTVKLNAKERQERATECAEKVVALKGLRERHKKTKENMKAAEDELEGEIDRLASASKTGEEEVDSQMELPT